jgi:ribosomal protein S18 acetylase RimI-like enzyme
MEGLMIRKVRADELEELTVISSRTFDESFAAFNTEEDMAQYLSEAFSQEQLASELSNPESAFFFAELDGTVVGYMKTNTGGAQSDDRFPDALQLERIYVLATHQGKGIGQRLLDEAMRMAREARHPTVWLSVWERNPGAIRFYERNGFVAFDSCVFVLGRDEQTDVMMLFSL